MNAGDFKGKNLVELLDMLEPVPEPAEISKWPETEGWVWLGLAIIVVAIWALRIWRGKRRANAYRRAALAELKSAGDNPIAIAAVLRRTALVAYPRGEVVAIAGDDWLSFLDKHTSRHGFLTETGRTMVSALYHDEKKAVPGLGALARFWVLHHKVETAS